MGAKCVSSGGLVLGSIMLLYSKRPTVHGIEALLRSAFVSLHNANLPPPHPTSSLAQDIALLDARKGALMFRQVGVPVLGIVENMSYFVCGNCGSHAHIFGHGGVEKTAEELHMPLLGKVRARVLIGGSFGSVGGHASLATGHARTFLRCGPKTYTLDLDVDRRCLSTLTFGRVRIMATPSQWRNQNQSRLKPTPPLLVPSGNKYRIAVNRQLQIVLSLAIKIPVVRVIVSGSFVKHFGQVLMLSEPDVTTVDRSARSSPFVANHATNTIREVANSASERSRAKTGQSTSTAPHYNPVSQRGTTCIASKMTLDTPTALAAVAAAMDIESLEKALEEASFLEKIPGDDRQKWRGT